MAMHNPFQISKPVAATEVIDRDSEGGELAALAREGNNARLVAPRRYGKTSLLNRVQEELGKGGWITVYVDLLGVVTIEEVAARIELAYTSALKNPLARWFAGWQRTLRPSLTIGGGPIPAALSLDPATQRAALVGRLALPSQVYKRSGQRVHVVFDEFQELDTIPGEADAVVRSEIQHHGDAASYVFAGSRLRMMEMIFADRKRAFYGQTKRVELSPLASDALGEYISVKFEQTGKELTPAALGALLDLVEGHPQRAMFAAHALWEVTNDTADIDQWDTARAALMDEVEDELKSTWVGLSPPMRSTLVSVATGGRPYRRGHGDRGAGVARSLKGLEGDGIVVRTRGRWRVIDPLLGEWIRAGRLSS